MNLAVSRPRVQILATGCVCRTEMTSDKGLQNLVAPICHHAAVFGMGKPLGLRIVTVSA